MKNNYIENFQKLEDYKAKLDKDYSDKLNSLIDTFINELNISDYHKDKITSFLTEMKNYSETTYKHSVDVAFRTYSLASQYLNSGDKFYNLNNKQFSELCVAAILHDAGKLDVDIEILHKEGKLSDEEFAKMKEHTVKAKEHIERFSKNIINLAVHHHEKLDGSGYPDHLKEEQIDLSNRILTIADITSALYQKRSYKEKLTTDEVVKILKEEALNNKIDKNITNDMINLISSQQIEGNLTV